MVILTGPVTVAINTYFQPEQAKTLTDNQISKHAYLAVNYFRTISYYYTGDEICAPTNKMCSKYRSGCIRRIAKLTSYTHWEEFQISTERCVC